MEFLLGVGPDWLPSKVASFVWRSEEACENRVLEFAAVGIVACFSGFRMKGHTLSASAGAHRRVRWQAGGYPENGVVGEIAAPMLATLRRDSVRI